MTELMMIELLQVSLKIVIVIQESHHQMYSNSGYCKFYTPADPQ